MLTLCLSRCSFFADPGSAAAGADAAGADAVGEEEIANDVEWLLMVLLDNVAEARPPLHFRHFNVHDR